MSTGECAVNENAAEACASKCSLVGEKDTLFSADEPRDVKSKQEYDACYSKCVAQETKEVAEEREKVSTTHFQRLLCITSRDHATRFLRPFPKLLLLSYCYHDKIPTAIMSQKRLCFDQGLYAAEQPYLFKQSCLLDTIESVSDSAVSGPCSSKRMKRSGKRRWKRPWDRKLQPQ